MMLNIKFINSKVIRNQKNSDYYKNRVIVVTKIIFIKSRTRFMIKFMLSNCFQFVWVCEKYVGKIQIFKF